MKKYYVLPKYTIAEEIESETAEEAVIDFATRIDTDMNQYFKASEKVMEETWEGEYSIVFAPLMINPSLFNVYIENKKKYKDGTSKWTIGIELKNSTKFMVLDAIRGTREEAVKRLEEIIVNGK